MRINHEIDLAWQVQYLVKLECHFSWQGQHFRSILGGNRGAKCCIFQYKIVSKIGRVRSIAQGDGFASGHESSSSCHCQGHSG